MMFRKVSFSNFSKANIKTNFIIQSNDFLTFHIKYGSNFSSLYCWDMIFPEFFDSSYFFLRKMILGMRIMPFYNNYFPFFLFRLSFFQQNIDHFYNVIPHTLIITTSLFVKLTSVVPRLLPRLIILFLSQ